jgi:BirA family transcriptional regulator, biotin operon repressor / biotin---[acetyl-CoA-carboxylase] ligase
MTPASDRSQLESPHNQLGRPRVHLRRTDSTNERARALAIKGAPSGTLVSADEQTAGRGRQGRRWLSPVGSGLLCSLVLREPPRLLSLRAGVAVCDAIGESARVKWPNDVVADAEHGLGKLGGILVEGRPQEDWAVLGIGVNVALRVEELPVEVRVGAASLQRHDSGVESLLEDLLRALAQRLAEPLSKTLDSWRTRDALRGRAVSWAHGAGLAEGVDDEGCLLVRLRDGTTTALSAGEVHLESVG